MTDHPIDVLVVGGAGVDTTVYVPELPLPYADTYAVPPVVDRIGNTGAGVALGCHALGLRVKFVDLIGDDPQGALIRGHLAARGVDFAHAPSEAGTRRSVLLVDPGGRRLSLFDPRAVPGQRMPRDLYLPALRSARHVHVSIVDFARHVYADIPDGTTVSTDLHDWDGKNPHHEDFAYSSDVVFLSAARLGGRREEIMRAIAGRGRASVVVCTDGAAGCHVLAGGRIRAFPAAPPPGPVADSNGAGDAFVSGFLYGRLTGRPLEECVRLGAVAGAHACTAEGTHEDPIGPDALLRALS
ncbi:carbohydrate kinase family protein [Microbispora sp. SCL1-1]|jgi:sugar/nucleoside kinase (ribokinase family)|uniref:carbohydrate kinase family protein n=1 Tax=Microbispora TaxID=2005 RepID=UPI001158A4B8|nr:MULTISPECIES: PfkB family carbohydrate kinase [unclassified Microbispora]NJP25905.1 carbohydrate kinase family protein [Microbispora sp. CL1-1]TQS13025.1 carbohydrate kinase family protein [Microbispora sp. SCL1-1]